jgi:signal transduction histidine kinase
MVPYFSAGLKNNELCIWICSEPIEVSEARRALSDCVADFDAFLASDQMQICSYRDWYLGPEGRFDEAAVLKRWRSSMDKALALGYAGLRVAGNTSWLSADDWQSFRGYEEGLYGAVAHEPMLTVCSYPRYGAWIPDIIEILSSHQRALIKRAQGWELIDCARQREIEWEYIFDEIAEGVLVVDDSANILVANNTCLRYFGARNLRELGANLTEMSRRFHFATESAPASLRLDSLLRRERSSGEHWTAMPKGTDCWLDLIIQAREVRPTTMASRRYLVLLQNVTELKSLDRMRERVIRMMGHELRNPLQVMKAVIPLMRSAAEKSGGEMRRYARTLGAQVEHLSSLIDELLTACRLTADGLEVRLTPLNLTDLVNEAVASAKGSGLHEISARYPADLDASVRADSGRIRQILANLIGNAIKYTPPGKRIWVDLFLESGRALVRVSDEGIGIPEGEAELIFQAFYRATNSALVSQEGIGLGLFISRQLARRHGGDLWVEKREGGGTVMTLCLPLLIEGGAVGFAAGANADC